MVYDIYVQSLTAAPRKAAAERIDTPAVLKCTTRPVMIMEVAQTIKESSIGLNIASSMAAGPKDIDAQRMAMKTRVGALEGTGALRQGTAERLLVSIEKAVSVRELDKIEAAVGRALRAEEMKARHEEISAKLNAKSIRAEEFARIESSETLVIMDEINIIDEAAIQANEYLVIVYPDVAIIIAEVQADILKVIAGNIDQESLEAMAELSDYVNEQIEITRMNKGTLSEATNSKIWAGREGEAAELSALEVAVKTNAGLAEKAIGEAEGAAGDIVSGTHLSECYKARNQAVQAEIGKGIGSLEASLKLLLDLMQSRITASKMIQQMLEDARQKEIEMERIFEKKRQEKLDLKKKFEIKLAQANIEANKMIQRIKTSSLTELEEIQAIMNIDAALAEMGRIKARIAAVN